MLTFLYTGGRDLTSFAFIFLLPLIFLSVQSSCGVSIREKGLYSLAPLITGRSVYVGQISNYFQQNIGSTGNSLCSSCGYHVCRQPVSLQIPVFSLNYTDDLLNQQPKSRVDVPSLKMLLSLMLFERVSIYKSFHTAEEFGGGEETDRLE